MARMERETASAVAAHKSGTSMAQATPMKAEIRCPPISGQGWVSGLWGAANSSTAEAPMEVTMICSPLPCRNWLLTRPTTSVAKKAPKVARNFSPMLRGVDSAIR